MCGFRCVKNCNISKIWFKIFQIFIIILLKAVHPNLRHQTFSMYIYMHTKVNNPHMIWNCAKISRVTWVKRVRWSIFHFRTVALKYKRNFYLNSSQAVLLKFLSNYFSSIKVILTYKLQLKWIIVRMSWKRSLTRFAWHSWKNWIIFSLWKID